MNRNRKLLVAGCGVVVYAIILWCIARNKKEQPVEDAILTNTGHPPVSREPTNSNTQPNRKPLDIQALHKDDERRQREFRKMSRTPIVFFGRVLDEQELPVKGAKIEYSANTIDVTLTQEGHTQAAVYSDAKGMFEISGIRSRGLGFEVTHPDYYSSGKNRNGVSYAGDRDRNIPDTPNKAWVFRMYKKRNPVKLLNSSGGGHGHMDGSPLAVKLGNFGQIVAEGKWGRQQAWDGKPFDWELRISVPGGGIMECNDEITFEAPAESYKSEYIIAMSKDDKNWKSDLKRSFYFKSGNVFGRADATISVYHDLFFHVHYIVNPDGSTNLESGAGSRITGP
jgi:hypothetical protein